MRHAKTCLRLPAYSGLTGVLGRTSTGAVLTRRAVSGCPASAGSAGFASAATLFLDCGKVSNSKEGNKRHRSARAAYHRGSNLMRIPPGRIAMRWLPRVPGAGHSERQRIGGFLCLSIRKYAIEHCRDVSGTFPSTGGRLRKRAFYFHFTYAFDMYLFGFA